MTENPRETQAESHVVELKEKVNNSSLMKHRSNREFSGGNRENQFVEQGRPVLYACTGCAANRSIDPDNGVPAGGWGSRRDYSPSR